MFRISVSHFQQNGIKEEGAMEKGTREEKNDK